MPSLGRGQIKYPIDPALSTDPLAGWQMKNGPPGSTAAAAIPVGGTVIPFHFVSDSCEGGLFWRAAWLVLQRFPFYDSVSASICPPARGSQQADASILNRSTQLFNK